MKLVGIVSIQTALVLGLDLYFNTHLGLWLLYFLPLLGSARVPSIRLSVSLGVILPLLIVLGGLCKIGQVPWEEIVVPRTLAIYAFGLTAVFLIRGKQFGAQARAAFEEAAVRRENEEKVPG